MCTPHKHLEWSLFAAFRFFDATLDSIDDNLTMKAIHCERERKENVKWTKTTDNIDPSPLRHHASFEAHQNNRHFLVMNFGDTYLLKRILAIQSHVKYENKYPK